MTYYTTQYYFLHPLRLNKYSLRSTCFHFPAISVASASVSIPAAHYYFFTEFLSRLRDRTAAPDRICLFGGLFAVS